MKTILVYLHTVTPQLGEPDAKHWDRMFERFMNSYMPVSRELPHEFMILACGGPIDADTDWYGTYSEANWLATYMGGGWDLGAYQLAAEMFKHYDCMIVCNSTVEIRHPDFVKLMAQPVLEEDCLVGAMGSFERTPHLRTCCLAFRPKTFLSYPLRVLTREQTFIAESSDMSITRYYQDSELGVWMRTADGGMHAPPHWRDGANIFRRGDQSDCIAWNKHNFEYAEADAARKAYLETMADGAITNQ